MKKKICVKYDPADMNMIDPATSRSHLSDTAMGFIFQFLLLGHTFKRSFV